MKYALIIPDGAADTPIADLGNKTPLEAARKPNMDSGSNLPAASNRNSTRSHLRE